MTENVIDFKKMPRHLCIQALGIHPETFDNWIREGASEDRGAKALYDLGKIVEWRIKKAENSRKPIKKEPKEKPEKDAESDPEALLKKKIAEQELRKKIRENDLADGLLCDRKQMEDKYFRLGRAIRDNLMSKDSVYGPQLNMVTGFEASVYLRKEFEKFCNSIADLNLLDDHALAMEYNYYFDLGVKYRDVDITVINENKAITYKE